MRSSIGLTFCIAGVLVFTSVVQAQNTHGTPGVDYPNYHSIPETSFSCIEQKYIPGFYADLETKCQAFHFCFQNHQESFLCPTGTIFNQAILACDAWYNSNCSLAPLFYSVNAGPAMENAGKKLPMLLKLRNRSAAKSTVQTSTANIHDKITSLYEASTDSTPTESTEKTSFSKTSDNESRAVDDSSNTAPAKASDLTVGSEQFSEDPLSVLGNDINGDISVEGETYGDQSEDEDIAEEVEEMNNLVYDPVTDGYYINYDQYGTEWQQDYEPVSDEFQNFYEFGNLDNRYEERMEDTSGSLTHEDSRDFNVVDEVAEFSKRQLEIGQSSKRVRRKPIYVVVKEDDLEVTPPSRPTGHRNPNEPESSESVATDGVESSTASLEASTEEGSEINATSEEPFPRPQRIPPHRRENYYTDKPLTTAEFERAILEELVLPGIDEENPGPILGSTHMQLDQADNEESREDMLADFPADEQSIYVENVMAPEGYGLDDSSYGKVPEGNVEIVYEESEADPSLQAGESPVEDADDTFVVIPDELESEENAADSPLVEETKDETVGAGYVDKEFVYEGVGTNEQIVADSQSDVAYDTYEDAYRYYKPSFESPQIYEPDSTPFRPVPGIKNFPHDIRDLPHIAEGKAPFAIEDDFNNYTPEMARIMWRYMLNDYRRHHYATQLGYQQAQPMSYESSYGAGSPYLYEDQYTNPYMGNDELFNYEASDYANEYSDPAYAAWVEQDAAESPEMSDTLEVADGILPIDETSSSSIDLREGTDESGNLVEDFIPGEVRNKENEDAYYVLDFDGEKQTSEDNESKLSSDEALESDADKSPQSVYYSEHPDLQILHEKEQQNIPSSDASISTSNISLATDSEESSETTQAESDDIRFLNSLLTSQKNKMKSSDSALKSKPVTSGTSSRTTESSLMDEKPVTISSALERLAALKTVKSPQTSNVENLGFSSDSRFISNMAFPESMDFGPYGFGANMGQYGMLDSVHSSKDSEAFSHRTGESEQSRLSKMSAIQERIRSMKQGKFGVFKKYMRSARNQKD